MRKIHYQSQPSKNSCTSACLAMVMGVSVEHVIETFHHRHWAGELSVADYLAYKDFPHVTFQQIDAYGFDFNGYVAMLTVPSLSTAGMFHNIIADARTDELFVYDPAKGFNGCKYYVTGGADCFLTAYDRATQVQLVAWYVDFIFSI